MSAEHSTTPEDAPMNMMELAPKFFESFFEFFRPSHQEGIVPSRIKELARLKIASINECDT